MFFEMRTEKPVEMNEHDMQCLSDICLAPYLQLGTSLIRKGRKAGGNMYRHQMDTFAILIDYGYIDPILLKAAVIHDVVEDVPDFDLNRIRNCDEDGEEVLKLVLEVTKRDGESKADFLKRILKKGSQRALILKSADRISNMISLGYVTAPEFIERTCDDTEKYVLEMALMVDYNMCQELISLFSCKNFFTSAAR